MEPVPVGPIGPLGSGVFFRLITGRHRLHSRPRSFAGRRRKVRVARQQQYHGHLRQAVHGDASARISDFQRAPRTVALACLRDCHRLRPSLSLNLSLHHRWHVDNLVGVPSVRKLDMLGYLTRLLVRRHVHNFADELGQRGFQSPQNRGVRTRGPCSITWLICKIAGTSTILPTNGTGGTSTVFSTV